MHDLTQDEQDRALDPPQETQEQSDRARPEYREQSAPGSRQDHRKHRHKDLQRPHDDGDYRNVRLIPVEGHTLFHFGNSRTRPPRHFLPVLPTRRNMEA